MELVCHRRAQNKNCMSSTHNNGCESPSFLFARSTRVSPFQHSVGPRPAAHPIRLVARSSERCESLPSFLSESHLITMRVKKQAKT